jgi:hypothetical protein
MTPDDNSTVPIAPPRHRLRTRKQQHPLPTFHRNAAHTDSSSVHNGKLSRVAAVCCLVVVIALSLNSFRSLEGDYYAGERAADGGGVSGGRRALQVELVQPANSYITRTEALAGEFFSFVNSLLAVHLLLRNVLSVCGLCKLRQAGRQAGALVLRL